MNRVSLKTALSTPFAYILTVHKVGSCSALSQGIFDWNLKTSLDLQLSRNTGWQLTRVSDTDALTPQTETAGNGPPQKYRYDYLKMEPKLIWSPAEAFEAEYHATISYGGSKIGTTRTLLLYWTSYSVCTSHSASDTSTSAFPENITGTI